MASQERKFEEIEAESVTRAQESEDRELFWENREHELERMTSSEQRHAGSEVPVKTKSSELQPQEFDSLMHQVS